MRVFRWSVLLVGLLWSTLAVALMPPHVTGTNIKDGVLTGSTLIIKGATLSATKVPTALQLTDVTTRRPVPWTHEQTCKWVGECESGRPGSCQEACVLTIAMKDVRSGARLRVRFLDLDQRFRVTLP